MPEIDDNSGEYQGKSQDEKKALKSYKDALEISLDYSRPYFDKFVRFYKLFAGVLPPELDGTFSKVMLFLAYSAVDSEIARSARAFFQENWFDLRANTPELEPPKQTAKEWLRYQMEDRQHFSDAIEMPIQSTHIFGIGYRWYGHRYKTIKQTRRAPAGFELGVPYGFHDEDEETVKSIIAGRNLHPFNVLPAPNGSLINAQDDMSDDCVDWLIVTDYMREDYIRKNQSREGWNKREIGRLFKTVGSSETDPTEEWKTDVEEIEGRWKGFTVPQWLRQIRDQKKNLPKRYRVNWMYQRDRWMLVAEDTFILYDGPPLVDCIPVARFVASKDMNNFFPMGLIEITEDLIISMIMNLCHRLDYQAGNMYPMTWVPEALLEHVGDKTKFDPTPYGLETYPASVADPSKAIFHDRNPEISPQAFIEDDKMTLKLQEILGQPGFAKGTNDQQYGDIGATGVVSLIGQGNARSMLRAMRIENSGIRESLEMTLKFGAKYVNDDEPISIHGEGGFPWEMVPHEAITDGYGISITGSRTLNMNEEAFKKMLSVAQFVLPMVQNPTEAIRQLMDKGGGWESIQDIIGPQQPAGLLPPTEGGGIGGAATTQNDVRSTMNRQTVAPQTGAPVPAGNVAV